MHETLTTLRGIHRLTIVGCVTVLLMAINPSLAHRYQAALDELQVAQMDFADFESWFEISPEHEDDDIATALWGVIQGLNGDTGLATAWSFRMDVEANLLPRLDSPHELLTRPLDKISLAEFHRIYASSAARKDVRILVPDEEQLRQKLEAALVERLPKRLARLTSDPDHREVNIRIRFQLMKYNNSDIYMTDAVLAIVECGMDEEIPLLIWGDQIAASSRELPSSSLMARLMQSPANGNVNTVSFIGDESELLPRCKSVWPEVHGLNLADAKQLLKKRKADTTADVTVMGFRFPKHMALLLGPLITAILFLYLQLHVKHAIPRMVRHGWCSDDFPWIAFYSDATSGLVTLGTLVFLPLVSCGLLTYSEWNVSGEFPWIIGSCTLFCTLSGITTELRILGVPAPRQPTEQTANQTLRVAA